MTTHRKLKNCLENALFTLLLVALPIAAQAHSYSAGAIRIGYPYAVPSVPGALNGAVYLSTLQNTGKQADRLLRASTPAAASTQIHTMAVDEGGVMRMRELDDVPLAPGALITMQPRQGLHIMLMGLKRPLKARESFPLTLEFERGGKVVTEVVIETPKTHHQMPN
jgi:periplasmic copper chaperone A